MQQIACNESLHLTTALCKHEAVWFCLFHRLKYTKTHAKRQLHKLLITRPWKKSVLLQQKVEKRGSQNVNVFARAYFVTHKFLTANIGYAYLFQLFGFHKSLAFCFRAFAGAPYNQLFSAWFTSLSKNDQVSEDVGK